jgi:hypothetical protein
MSAIGYSFPYLVMAGLDPAIPVILARSTLLIEVTGSRRFAPAR